MGYEWKAVIHGREAGLQEESGEEAWVALLCCSETPRFPPSASSSVSHEGLQRLVTCIRPGTEQALITNMLNESLTFSPSPNNYN